ncbi:MAG TPA: hypothetical protein VL947_07310 [Cytophagales bacterium]|nr:hypothetical protein [Cytophagales bacterium]
MNNPYSGENLAIGLVAVAHPTVFFKVSAAKLACVAHLNPHAQEEVRDFFRKLQHIIPFETDKPDHLLCFKNEIDLEFLHHLSLFKTGFVQFSSLDFVDSCLDEGMFNIYFKRYIGMD